MMLNLPKKELENRYRTLRAAARLATTEEFAGLSVPDVRLAEIGPEALAAAALWQKRVVNWNWDDLVRKLRRRPRRIELAIWVDPVLCGLAIGKISDRRVTARIDRIERSPEATQLVGLIGEIATSYLDVLGTLAGCRESVIVSPAPGLVAFYKELGYTKEMIKRGKLIGLKKIL
jgi:hypothetical protein